MPDPRRAYSYEEETRPPFAARQVVLARLRLWPLDSLGASERAGPDRRRIDDGDVEKCSLEVTLGPQRAAI
jgi:hypothetical protein